MGPLADTTYVLPIRRTEIRGDDELAGYLARLAELLPVIVVDGSPGPIFAAHATQWPPSISHIPIDQDRRGDLNGKVAGVVTGMRRVRTAKAIVADDDVRYSALSLRRVAALLDDAEIVRPQNVYSALPWHALLDTGRTLIARATGGDWPGTLGLRAEIFEAAGGYDGDVLFENLELVRTLRTLGGRERIAFETYVERRPPPVGHYLGQRVRQAYDEFARPARLAAQLAAGPLVLFAAVRWGAAAPVVAALAAIGLAEAGRRRAGGREAFPALAAATAPLWAAERAVTVWIALAMRLLLGGVPYSRGTLRRAANSERALRARFASGALSTVGGAG